MAKLQKKSKTQESNKETALYLHKYSINLLHSRIHGVVVFKSEKILLFAFKEFWGPFEIGFAREVDEGEQDAIAEMALEALQKSVGKAVFKRIYYLCDEDMFLWEDDCWFYTEDCQFTQHMTKGKNIRSLLELVFEIDLGIPVEYVAFGAIDNPSMLETWTENDGEFRGWPLDPPQLVFARAISENEQKAILMCIRQGYLARILRAPENQLSEIPPKIQFIDWRRKSKLNTRLFLTAINEVNKIVPIKEVWVGIKVYW